MGANQSVRPFCKVESKCPLLGCAGGRFFAGFGGGDGFCVGVFFAGFFRFVFPANNPDAQTSHQHTGDNQGQPLRRQQTHIGALHNQLALPYPPITQSRRQGVDGVKPSLQEEYPASIVLHNSLLGDSIAEISCLTR